MRLPSFSRRPVVVRTKLVPPHLGFVFLQGLSRDISFFFLPFGVFPASSICRRNKRQNGSLLKQYLSLTPARVLLLSPPRKLAASLDFYPVAEHAGRKTAELEDETAAMVILQVSCVVDEMLQQGCGAWKAGSGLIKSAKILRGETGWGWGLELPKNARILLRVCVPSSIVSVGMMQLFLYKTCLAAGRTKYHPCCLLAFFCAWARAVKRPGLPEATILTLIGRTLLTNYRARVAIQSFYGRRSCEEGQPAPQFFLLFLCFYISTALLVGWP